MSSHAAILLITEGEKTEVLLFERILAQYELSGTHYICPYKTNIYELHRKMFCEPNSEPSDYDITNVLRERESDPDLKAELDRHFSDILLVFDYEPQDTNFSPKAIREMQEYFNESTEMGKLYISYPMIEAYRHFTTLPDPSFNGRFVDLSDTQHYKRIVGEQSCIKNINNYDRETFDIITVHNIEKACRLADVPFSIINSRQCYENIDLLAVLSRQSEATTSSKFIHVLCTALFFICDYAFNKIDITNVQSKFER